MISFQTPLWLILLGLIPLIHWLHRFRQLSRTFPTTTLFLWRRFRHDAGSDGSPARPDPRWLLRALVTSLLVLSLAGPYVQSGQSRSIEVWLDDSLSMFTFEGGQQRLQVALTQLHRYLLESRATRIQVHSLGDPASSLSLDPGDADAWLERLSEWTSRPRAEPSPPPAAGLSPHSRHILITDGADSLLNDWASSAPLQKVIQAGQADHNIALTRLSLRASLGDPDSISAIARIDNYGDTPQNIRLELQQDGRIIDTQQLEIPASQKKITVVTLPAGDRGKLQARVHSADDPLPLDNELQMQLEELHEPLRYHMPTPCGRYIKALLDSQPDFIQDRITPAVIIDCSEQRREYALPTLKLHPPRSLRRTGRTAHWHGETRMDSIRMAAGIPYGDQAPTLGSGAMPVLSADGHLLALKPSDSTRIIESFVDTGDPVFARSAEYPLLILGLVEQLTGHSPDMRPVTVSREIDASRIKPAAIAARSASPVETLATSRSYVPLLLSASLLLLVFDAVLAAGLLRFFAGHLR